MNTKKDNFNKAMFDMFGVGKDDSAEEEVEETLYDEYEEGTEESEDSFEEEVPVERPIVYSAPSYVTPVKKTAVSYIAEGTFIEGTLKSQGDVEIAGNFAGNVVAEGKVTLHTAFNGNVDAGELTLVDCVLTGDVHTEGRFVLGKNSEIHGNVSAGGMVCAGLVEGDLNIVGDLALEDNAYIQGDIHTSTMSMARGAIIHGSVAMGNK